MCDERLNSSALLLIENNIVSQLDTSEIIQKFTGLRAGKKCCKIFKYVFLK